MAKVKILDCTLRDGGYVNQWEFGSKNISKIVSKLTNAGIEFIECGFLKNTTYDKNYSIFSDINLVKDFIQNKKTQFTLMLNLGEFDIEGLSENINNDVILRVAFKKWQYEEAIESCQKLNAKGYKIFMNPMHTDMYTKDELIKLVNDVNIINPEALSIVDTTGGMTESVVCSIYDILDKTLAENISICFHSHNNLHLSFSNAQALILRNSERNLIIDSTVFGMGRGAGNICTEQLAKFLNDFHGKKYNILSILEILNEVINPIFERTPWGSSAPYYLAAINHCHPNYAKYISREKNMNVEKISKILRSIPDNKKRNFDVELINQLCY